MVRLTGQPVTRREALLRPLPAALLLGSLSTVCLSRPALSAPPAATALLAVASPEQQIRESTYAYGLTVPAAWESTGKPVKTHMHEALLSGQGVKIGITVDPVKIASLDEFGTPEQVAERVLAVERTRDGIKTVELRNTFAEPGPPSYYTIEYLSDGSRGTKVFLCK